MAIGQNWQDIAREVEVKWPMVTKEIWETVLKKGMKLISQC